jgi:hypothetical protein
MKKLLLILACLLITIAAIAQNEVDTVVVAHPNKVMIYTDSTQQKVEVFGRENEPSYHYSSTVKLNSDAVSEVEKRSDWVVNIPFVKKRCCRDKRRNRIEIMGLSNLGIGWMNAIGAPSGMDVTMGSSYELFIENIAGMAQYFGHSFVTVGVGLDYKNYRMTDSRRFIKDGDNITIGTYPDGTKRDFSRLHVRSWIFPVMYGYDFGHDINMMVGPILCLNVAGNLKTRYTDGKGDKQKLTDNTIHQTPVTVDFKAAISIHGLGFYVKYSPCNVLRTTYGPKFQSLSLGFNFF